MQKTISFYFYSLLVEILKIISKLGAHESRSYRQSVRLLYTYVKKRSVSLNTLMGRYIFSTKPRLFSEKYIIDFRNQI